MPWVIINLVTRPDLDDFALTRHRHAVAEMAHNRQVMGDKDLGQAELLLNLFEQVNHLRQNGHFQLRYRFVTNNDLGI